MTPELLLVWARAIVIAGTVLFAFTLALSGLALLLKEYAKVSSWKQMRELMELSGAGKVDARLAKGVVVLDRLRPGLVMIVVAAALMCVCVLRPFEYQSSTTPLTKSGAQALAEDTRLMQWLGRAEELKELSGPDLYGRLVELSDGVSPDRLEFVAADGDTVASLAEKAFGSDRFVPLLTAFNPMLPKEPTAAVRILTPVCAFRPPRGFGGERYPVATMKRILMNGSDDQGVYRESLLPLAKRALARDDYQENPAAFWKRSGQSPIAISSGLQGLTNRGWGWRRVTVEPGDTVDTIARVVYGSREFAPVIQFLNPELHQRLASPGGPLEPGLAIDVVTLVDSPRVESPH